MRLLKSNIPKIRGNPKTDRQQRLLAMRGRDRFGPFRERRLAVRVTDAGQRLVILPLRVLREGQIIRLALMPNHLLPLLHAYLVNLVSLA